MVLKQEEMLSQVLPANLYSEMPKIEETLKVYNGFGTVVACEPKGKYGQHWNYMTRFCSCGGISVYRSCSEWSPTKGQEMRRIDQKLEQMNGTWSPEKRDLHKKKEEIGGAFIYSVSNPMSVEQMTAADREDLIPHHSDCLREASGLTKAVYHNTIARFVPHVYFILDSPDGKNVRFRRYDHRHYWYENEIENYYFPRGQFFYSPKAEIMHAIKGKKAKNSFSFSKARDKEGAARELFEGGLSGQTTAHLTIHIELGEGIEDCEAWTRTGLKEFFHVTMEGNSNASVHYRTRQIKEIGSYMLYRSQQPTAELLVKAGFHPYVLSAMQLQVNLAPSVMEEIQLPRPIQKMIRHESRQTIHWLRTIHEHTPLTEAFIHYVFRQERQLLNRSEVLTLVSRYGYSCQDIMSYVDRAWGAQAIPASETLVLWKDTLSMAEDLDVKVERFPKHLKREHDVLARDYQMVADEMMHRRYESIRKEAARKYRMSDDLFHIREPESLVEIHEEGKALRHCVSSYAKNVASGETMILFIRRNEEPDIPFLTLEVKRGRFVQCRGKGNRHYRNMGSPEVEKFVEQWKEDKKVTE